MAESKPETPGLQGGAAETARIAKEQRVGKILSAARESRGLSSKDIARDAHVPEHYLKMIEGDDYSLIADQVYLLPFLRRYAQFVGLEPEDIAGRFVREVQRADVNAVRMPNPIPMLERKPRSNRLGLIAAVLALVFTLVVVGLVIRHERLRTPAAAIPQPSGAQIPAQIPAPAAPAVP